MNKEISRLRGQEFLPLDFEGVTEATRKRAVVELFEDEETRNQCIQIVRNLLKGEKDEYRNDDAFILQFLRARKFDAKKACSLIKSKYSTFNRYPELYSNFDFTIVFKTLETDCLGFMPYRDSDGSVIFMFQNPKWIPAETSVADIIRSVTAGALHILRYQTTQVAGIKCVFDFKGLSLKRLTYVHPSYYWLMADALQNCLPLRFRSLHILNAGIVFDYAWKMFKPLISKKVKDRIHFHGKDLKSLHQYVSPCILSEEFGGELGPYSNKNFSKQLKQSEEYIVQYLKDILRQ